MRYSHTDQKGHVIGWYDTESHDYKLPPKKELTEVPDEIWANRHRQLWRKVGNRLQGHGPSPEESFEIMRQSRIEGIWRDCEKEISKGFEVDGHHYAADPIGLLWATHGGPVMQDGAMVTLTTEDAAKVQAAYGSLCATHRIRAQSLAAQLRDAKTVADIGAVRW